MLSGCLTGALGLGGGRVTGARLSSSGGGGGGGGAGMKFALAVEEEVEGARYQQYRSSLRLEAKCVIPRDLPRNSR